MKLKFAIKIAGGQVRSLEELRLNLTSINRANLRPDTASLRWSGTHTEICPIAHDNPIEIYLRDARIFVGRARLGKRTNDGVTITVSNALADLDEMTLHANLTGGYFYPILGTTFQTIESALYYDSVAGIWREPNNPITWTVSDVYSYDPAAGTGTINVNAQVTSQLYLHPARAGVLTTAQRQCEALLALAASPLIGSILQAGDVTLAPIIFPRPQLVSDISILEALRQSLEILPDAVSWVDYSVSGPPVLSIARQPSVVLYSTSGNYSTGIRHLSVEVEPMHHLVPPCVVVRRMVGGDPGDFIPPTVDYTFVWPVGTPIFQRRALCHSLGSETTDIDCQILAKSLYESLEKLRGNGTVALHNPDYTLPIRPGHEIVPLQVPSAEGLTLIIQSTQWNPVTGTSTCEVGYPPHLGLSQLLDLRAWLKRAWFGR